MNLTKQDKAMLTDEFRKAWRRRDGSIDQEMVDFCMKKTSAYVFVRGALVTLDKPDIEKNFCFGYRSSVYFDESDDARRMADYAATHEDYFVRRNVEGTDAYEIMRLIDGLMAEDSLDESWHSLTPYLNRVRYTSQDDDCRMGNVVWVDRWNTYGRKTDEELTIDDLTELYRICFEEQMKFCKRLRTYLKRYGLSKVRTWTYWADE